METNTKTSEAINEIATALAKAQGILTGAAKDANNPFFKSKYADLSSVWDACRGPLSSNGLSVVQLPSTELATVTVTTILMHSSGQWISGSVSATAKDAGPQSIGSAITYLRRYALQSIAGVAPEDDDGNAANGHSDPQKPQGKPPAKQLAKPSTDPMAGDDEFLKAMDDAFKAAKFDVPQADNCIGAVCKKKKVSHLVDLSLQDRHEFVAAITSGKLDTFKSAA